MTAPKLSICIATLNRAAFIGETLESIIAQANDQVEIVVVDGASTDNTTEVVYSYQQKFPRLNYVRLEAKGGVDRDYDRTVQLAQGEYCWLMSDDDLIKPGAIQAVLNAIDEKYGLIVVNAEIRTFDFSRIIEPQRLAIKNDQIYSPADYVRLFTDTAYYMSFIGSVVIKRCVWNERERETFFGTEFVHLGVIFQQPLRENALVMANPWIVIRNGNALWASRYFQIWMFKYPQLIWSFPDYPDSAKQQVYLKEPWRRAKILLVSRATGVFTQKEYNDWLKPHMSSLRERSVAKGIALLPGCLANLSVFLYFRFFKPTFRLAIEDFRNSRYYYADCLRAAFRRLGLLPRD